MSTIAGFGDSIIYGSNLERSWLYTLLERLEPGKTITYTPAWPWTWWGYATAPPPYLSRNDYWYETDAVRVYNMGIGGDRTAWMATRFDGDVAYRLPEYCMVLGGINDIENAVLMATIETNLHTIYDHCVTHGVVPIPCTLTPLAAGTATGGNLAAWSASADTLNSWIVSFAASNGWDCIDFHTMLHGDTATYISADGVHPTQAGYDAMSAGIDLGYFGRMTATAAADHIDLAGPNPLGLIERRVV